MNKDNIIAKSKWEFNQDVSNCFDDMLARSIPDYDTMRKLILMLAESFLGTYDSFHMLDLGCSNGINLQQFIDKFGNKGQYFGYDVSKPMIDCAIDRLTNYIDDKNISLELQQKDIRYITYPLQMFNVVTSILTIQFVPIEDRPLLLQKIYNSMSDGGVFIMVEKVLQSDYIYDKAFTENYYNIKQQNGYSLKQIEAKRQSLKGVLVPNTHCGNIELLQSAGFKHIDTFWKCLNFEAYIMYKGNFSDISLI